MKQSFMQSPTRKALAIFTIIYALLLLADFFLITIRLEESSQKVYWLNGTMLGICYTQYYMKDFYLIGEIYKLLYNNFSGIPWYQAFTLFTNAVSVYIIMAVVIIETIKAKISLTRMLPALAGLLLVANLNQLNMDLSRTGFLYCTAAIMLIYVSRNFNAGFKKTFFLITAFFWFLLGTLIRPEAAIGTLVVSTIPLLYCYQWKLKTLLLQTYPLLIIIALYTSVFLYRLEFDDSFYYQIEPDFEYELMDRENHIDLAEMKTFKDSARYKIIINAWMLADSNQTPPVFIRSLIKKENNFFNRYFILMKEKSTEAVREKFQILTGRPSIWILWLTIISLLLFVNRSRNNTYLQAFLIVYSVLLLIFVIGNVNKTLDKRFTEPTIFALATMAVLASTVKPQSPQFSKKIPFIFVSGIMSILILASFAVSYREHLQVGKHVKANYEFLNQVNALKEYEYVMLASDLDIFNLHIFHTSKIFQNKQVVPVDLVQYSYSPQTKQLLKTITNCPDNDFLCRFQFLKNKKDKTLIVGSHWRLDAYKNYLRDMYGFDFNYMPLNIQHQNKIDQVYVIR